MATLIKDADPFAKKPGHLLELIGLIELSLQRQRQDMERTERLVGALKASLEAYARPPEALEKPKDVRTFLPEVQNVDLEEIWDLYVTEEIVLEGDAVRTSTRTDGVYPPGGALQ